MNTVEERSKVIAQMFATHPEVNTFYVTTDNQGFTEMSRAESHIARLKNKDIKKVHRDDKAEAEKEPTVLDSNLKDLPSVLAAVNDMKTLTDLLIEESEKELPRKGALAIINDRITLLTTEAAKGVAVVVTNDNEDASNPPAGNSTDEEE